MKDEKKLLKNNRLLKRDNGSSNLTFVLLYSAVFAVMAMILFSEFFFCEQSFVRRGDAFTQHYKALIYFARYVKACLSTVFVEHSFIFPQFDFEIGLGSDILTTFSYYSFGDPFYLFAFLVPEEYMHLYYEAAVVLRFYFTGLSFSYLCFATGKKNKFAVLAGSIAYCFSAYALYSGLKHPFFINPMVFLPLIVVGVEKIIKGKSPFLLAAAVAVSEISNYYFFYMIVLLTVIYGVVRLITNYKTDIKAMLSPFMKITAASVLGVCIGAVVFLPTVLAFIGDTRSASENAYELFYRGRQYLRMPVSFVTSHLLYDWLYPGMSVLLIPCAAVLFSEKKKNTLLKILIVLAVAFMCFPIVGRIFNGFSYVCNRWCFGYNLVAAYIIVSSWDKLISAEHRQLKAVAASVAAYLVLCVLTVTPGRREAIIPFALLVLTVIILFAVFMKKIKVNTKLIQSVFLAFSLISILTYGYYLFSPAGRNYASEFNTDKRFENVTYESNDKVLQASKYDNSEFFRYSGRDLSENAAFIDGLKSTQFYWSLSNGNVSATRTDLNMAENIPYYYIGFDERTALNALASVRYFYNSNKNNSSVPYGYVASTDKVWKNMYALPLGYTYDSYITKTEYDKFNNSVEKQEAMLQSVVLEKASSEFPHGKVSLTARELDYKIARMTRNVTVQNGNFVVTKNGAKALLVFKPVRNSETYLSISNMNFKGTRPMDMYSDNEAVDPENLYSFDNLTPGQQDWIISSDKKWKQPDSFDIILKAKDADGKSYEKKFNYMLPDASFYANRKSFDVNLGYTESGICSLLIEFPCVGTYSFDSFKIISQPMNNYIRQVNRLKEDILTDVVIRNNTLEGKISLSENKILCLSVPYSDGWRAYIDGEEAELLKANGMYCAIELSDGEHEIMLKYETPGLKLGATISFFGLAIFLFGVYYNKYGKKKLKNKNEKTEAREG